MHEFTHGDTKVAFTVLSGEVLGSEKLSETRITTTGGGATAGSVGANGQPVRINSESIINHEFWIRTPDGVEHDVKLRGVDIPLRAGQQVSLFSALRKDGKAPVHAVLQNHSAAKRWVMRDGEALNKELGLVDFKWSSLWIALLLWIAVSFASPALGFFAVIAYICYQCYQASKRKKLMVSALNAFLDKLSPLAANRAQPQANPFEAMLKATGIDLSEAQVQTISMQFELPVQVETPTQVQTPAEEQPSAAKQNTALDSEGVRRALSRKG
ncbi:hypothetical protein [Pseudomonas putida]|uniref:hypothetical protein n=1 Tax=Pseudomonas putida TaxID=303 RepID=UPI003D971919